MHGAVEWHTEFARVIGCTRCSIATDGNLLRDAEENLPQPGYVGARYDASRVLLVGQNPATPKKLADRDRTYTAALRALRKEASPDRYAHLASVLRDFIPQWPVHRHYFPLAECGLTLDDIAYLNLVRCRTAKDKAPKRALVAQCNAEHFNRWVRALAPRVVVFIGKWAFDRGTSVVRALGVPHGFVNRQRNLASAKRSANRSAVVCLVTQHRGQEIAGG